MSGTTELILESDMGLGVGIGISVGVAVWNGGWCGGCEVSESGDGGGCECMDETAVLWGCERIVSGDGGVWVCAEGDNGGGLDVSVRGEGGGWGCGGGEEEGGVSCSLKQLSWTTPRTAWSSLTASLCDVSSRDTLLIAVMMSLGFNLPSLEKGERERVREGRGNKLRHILAN